MRKAGIRVFIVIICCVLSLLGRAQTGSGNDTVVVGQDTGAAVVPVDSTAAVTVDSAAMDTSLVQKASEEVPQEPYKKRRLSDSVIRALLRDPAYDYANNPDYWLKDSVVKEKVKDTRSEPAISRFRWDIVLYLLLSAVLLFAVYRIIKDNDIQLFYRASRKRGMLDMGTATEPETTLEHQLQGFIANGDYRQAVRYLYLIALRELNDRGLIRMQAKLTNHDYIQQLKGKNAESEFRFLTFAYEKVWYGEFALGQEQFQRLHHHFEHFSKNIR